MEAAKRQESRYARSLIEASLDPLVTISIEDKILDMNQATINITGLPRELLTGTDFQASKELEVEFDNIKKNNP